MGRALDARAQLSLLLLTSTSLARCVEDKSCEPTSGSGASLLQRTVSSAGAPSGTVPLADDDSRFPNKVEGVSPKEWLTRSILGTAGEPISNSSNRSEAPTVATTNESTNENTNTSSWSIWGAANTNDNFNISSWSIWHTFCKDKDEEHGAGWLGTLSGVLLFILKCTIPAVVESGEFEERMTRVGPLLYGVACQFVISPFCGAFIAWLFKLEYSIGLALVIVTSCPGGSFSNLFCHVFNGDLALSVTMTGMSTFIGIGMLPLNICIYAKLLYGQEVLTVCQWYGIVRSLLTVIVGLSVGYMLSKCLNSRKWRDRFAVIGVTAGLSMFVLMLFVSSNQRKQVAPVWKKPLWLYFVVLAPVVMATLGTVLVSRFGPLQLSPPQRVAVVFEAVYQNTALGAAIMLQVFSFQAAVEAAGIAVLYQVMQGAVLIGFGVCAHFTGWTLVDPKEVPLSVALVSNFQQKSAG